MVFDELVKSPDKLDAPDGQNRSLARTRSVITHFHARLATDLDPAKTHDDRTTIVCKCHFIDLTYFDKREQIGEKSFLMSQDDCMRGVWIDD